MRVICIDAGEKFGYYPTQLTEGKEYEVVKIDSECVSIIDDHGKESISWATRFVPSDGSVLAYNEVCED